MSAPAASVRKVSSLFQVSRYAFLGLGVVYGAVHANTLKKNAEKRKVDAEYGNRIKLIQSARDAWEVKKAQKANSSGAPNFEDPNFDVEAWFNTLA
ncbi:ATP synthase subunit e, mitochondrial [Smittium culicis]|uniref:ATP synthase F(0) complex subunit e, mitochondrial n=1 Tax=Smittium culicis TaxID=133412 RepID=A0A1R1XD30_9FUNG|nr:ATP synthase subunit e, mitochondrial [Smittium culicis]